jgi:hypothetical protein
MTPLELFAYVILPLAIALGGWLIASLYVWADKRRERKNHPAE